MSDYIVSGIFQSTPWVTRSVLSLRHAHSSGTAAEDEMTSRHQSRALRMLAIKRNSSR